MAAPRVAIVGAGAAGLVCARELLAAGMRVVVFEQRSHPGGVWRYSSHPTMYRGLRTNLPKEVMSYIGHEYDAALPSFVGHAEVADYLEAYAESLGTQIQYSSTVIRARVEEGGRGGLSPLQQRLGRRFLPWSVTVAETVTRAERTETFDALVLCNGHFAVPFSPSYPGTSDFPGRILHSVEYDDVSEFAGQRVLVVGTASSGTDIAWELTAVAAEVVVSQRSLSEAEAAAMPAEPPCDHGPHLPLCVLQADPHACTASVVSTAEKWATKGHGYGRFSRVKNGSQIG